jgi:ribosomal protein L11 methyltransferase
MTPRPPIRFAEPGSTSIVVTPPWDLDGAAKLGREAAAEAPGGAADLVTIVIEPSMGFGTGHHESTRLCLTALQRMPLAGRSVVDVGTGSGVLAIAAARLGAAHAVGIDDDRDALDSASANVALNAIPAGRVEMRQGNLLAEALPVADVVLGNLTGALLRRAAATLRTAIAPGGVLIVSGFTEDERLAIEHAFAPLAVSVALVGMTRPATFLPALPPTTETLDAYASTARAPT